MNVRSDYLLGLATLPAAAAVAGAGYGLYRYGWQLAAKIGLACIDPDLTEHHGYRARAAAIFATTPRAVLHDIAPGVSVALLLGDFDRDRQRVIEKALIDAQRPPNPAPTLRPRGDQ